MKTEIDRLVDSIAAGVPAATVAGQIRSREADVARIDAHLRRLPQAVAPDVHTLRAALEQRTADWRRQLRQHPREARLLVRRLVGALTLSTEPQVPPPNTTTLVIDADLF